MLGFISRIENTALSVGLAAANGGRGGQQVTRVIRHVPNRAAIQSIVAAARREKARADAAEAEIVRLRRSLHLTRQALQAASSR